MSYCSVDYQPHFSDWRGMYDVGNVPVAKNLAFTPEGVRARKPGEWSNARKKIEVYGPNGERVTYRNHKQIEKTERETWNALRDAPLVKK